MMRIGQFSRLSGVTIKTLRHYDDINLFNPAYIDEQTAFRYYTLEQLVQLNRILSLKELGLSLEQIAGVLHQELSFVELQETLLRREHELQKQIEEAHQQLARVRNQLNQLSQAGALPTYDIVIKNANPIQIAGLRMYAQPQAELDFAFQRLFTELSGRLEAHNHYCSAEYLALYHTDDLTVATMDIEAAIPVNNDVQLPTSFVLHELPATLMATVVHHGEMQALFNAYDSILSWIAESPFSISGAHREYHLHSKDLDHAVIEIQIPIKQHDIR